MWGIFNNEIAAFEEIGEGGGDRVAEQGMTFLNCNDEHSDVQNPVNHAEKLPPAFTMQLCEHSPHSVSYCASHLYCPQPHCSTFNSVCD